VPGAAALLAAAACSHGTLRVQPPNPSGQVQQLCAHLGNRLPATLNSLKSRVVEPSSPFTHAWGGPPVVLRCGVAAPRGYSPSSSTTTAVDGVRWYQVIGKDAVVWTAIRRGPSANSPVFVELTVPTSYDAQGGFLVALAGPIKTALP
jgi:hypothetical protein